MNQQVCYVGFRCTKNLHRKNYCEVTNTIVTNLLIYWLPRFCKIIKNKLIRKYKTIKGRGYLWN